MTLMRAFLVAVALTLAPTQVWAECAWVLWVHETKTHRVEEKTTTSDLWEPLAAAPNERGCDSKLRDQMGKVSRLSTTKPPEGERMYYKVSDGHIVSLLWYRKAGAPDDLPLRTQTLSYSCLPETIDPRGPKGGAR
jgi:hypothetical protein